MLRPNRTHKGLRRTFSWHASVGIWAAIGMLFLSATGITWSQFGGENVTKLRAALSWATPAVSTELGGQSDAEDAAGAASAGAHAHHGTSAEAADPAVARSAIDPADFDMMLAMARGVGIDSGELEILPPEEDGSAWVVQEIQRSWPTQVDSVAFDPEAMEATDRVDFSDYGAAAKLARWGVDLHMGTLFGLANQMVLFALAIGIAAMVVWGYVMWWQRRPKRNPAKRFGRAPARGVLNGAPWWGVAVIVLAAIAIGVFLPPVGISLVGFVVIDVLLGLREWRRERQSMTI